MGGVENTNYNGESNNKSGGKTSPRMHRKRQNGYELSKGEEIEKLRNYVRDIFFIKIT